ncbi:very long chain fatty acid elongase 4-like [Saccoglossus kowalevskii]|uniref:Elongation of very long chain fatty acids protein n=1 Tax=Saccoglossus kowalevskii TaxID=10224 RepID=A0ABM0GL43_SACKO|nr:PREDICTED: elongation of very long chain fatty acids protein 4-like [Saccoglossus kowalevskii]
MSSLIEHIKEFVAWAESKQDPRVKDWPMMSSPVLPYTLSALYLLIVWKGPHMMKNKKAYDLKYFMFAYNICLVALSSFMFHEFIITAWPRPGFSWACADMDYSDDPMAVRLAGACWWFFFSKFIEFIDTFIFILRKKSNQISFLHVYHHSTMPILWWIGVKFVPGGQSFFTAMFNSLIHAIMYSYYLLSALGPGMKPYLWWKKYLTSLQLAQFILGMFQTLTGLFVGCNYPKGYLYALVIYLFSHLVLFSNFFKKTYLKPRKTKHKQLHSNGQSSDNQNGYYNLKKTSKLIGKEL